MTVRGQASTSARATGTAGFPGLRDPPGRPPGRRGERPRDRVRGGTGIIQIIQPERSWCLPRDRLLAHAGSMKVASGQAGYFMLPA